ncbi:hypothetical protein, partial [Tsukamurella paurometabola]|nr:hypothetical protein [Tsukamurella paurometabola]
SVRVRLGAPVAARVPDRPRNVRKDAGQAGLLALLFAFIPLIGMIAWLLSPIGLLLSGIGLAKSPRGLAIAGMVLSGVALLICFGC